MKNFVLNKNFCAAPWISTTIENEGNFKPCCYINNKEFIIKAETIHEYYNSNELKDLRHKFMNNDRPDVCKKCWLSESNDEEVLDSMRKKINCYAKNINLLSKISKITDNNGMVNENIISWADLHFSNKCNFSCIICDPHRSRSIEKKFLKEYRILNNNFSEILLSENNEKKILKWFDSTGYKTVKLLNVTGGEPLLQSGFFRLLDIMISNKVDKNCQLSITTNGSISKTPSGKDIINDYLVKYKNEIKITMSIDHCGKKGEFLRPGFKEKIWLENYHRFSKEKNISLRTSIALSLLNIPTIHELFDMMKENLHTNILNNIHFVYRPNSIACNQILLDKDLLNCSVTSLDKSIKILEDFSPATIPILESLKTKLLYEFKGEKKYLQLFKDGIYAISERRNINFLDMFPEHKNFWKLSLNY